MSDLMELYGSNGKRQLVQTGVTADISLASTGVVAATAVTFTKPYKTAPKIFVSAISGSSVPSTAVWMEYAASSATTGFTPSILVTTAEASDNVKLNWMAIGNPA